jgi:hypothetical protein
MVKSRSNVIKKRMMIHGNGQETSGRVERQIEGSTVLRNAIRLNVMADRNGVATMRQTASGTLTQLYLLAAFRQSRYP